MIPHPVASTPKETTPPHAVAPPPPHAPFNLLQLLAATDPNAPRTGSGTPSDAHPSIQNPPDRAKHRGDAGDAAGQAAALAVPQAMTPQPVAKSAASATVTTAPAGTATASAAQAVLPAAASQLAAAAIPSGKGNGQTGTSTTPPPPGAAELEARVSLGAQTLISGPAPAVDGLWHHIGQAVPSAKDGSADASTGDSTEGDAAASQPDAKLAAAETEASLAKSHAAPVTATGAAQADPGTAPGTPASGTAGAASAGTAAAIAALPTPDASTNQAGTAPQNAPAQQSAILQQPLPVYQQVAINLRQAAQIGTDRIEIQLKPESLGAIHVKLDVTHDGHISAVISADRSDTLNMLKQDSSGLQQALRDAGLQADNGSLSFNLRGDGQGFAQGWHAPAPSHSASSGSIARDPSPILLSQYRYRSHAGALDIEV
ncbi:MAG: flagellar hook-length control protein FliK [Stellaceae bacterium]